MSTREATVSMLETMSEEDLRVINQLITRMMFRPQIENPYRPLSEDELYTKLDNARQETEAGLARPAEVAVAEMREKYGF